MPLMIPFNVSLKLTLKFSIEKSWENPFASMKSSQSNLTFHKKSILNINSPLGILFLRKKSLHQTFFSAFPLSCPRKYLHCACEKTSENRKNMILCCDAVVGIEKEILLMNKILDNLENYFPFNGFYLLVLQKFLSWTHSKTLSTCWNDK